MSKDRMLDYDWHNKTMNEEHGSLLQCLGPHQERIISIEKTELGYRFVECCDSYYGRTLTQEQFERLIAELQALAAS